jgi:orotate phosphoribosyltransferase
MLVSDKEYIIFKNWMREYIDDNCIVRTGKEINFLLPGKKPGTHYTWQFYLRCGLFDPIFLSTLSQMFIYKVEREIGHFNFQLSGLETAATPMLASIPLVAKGFGINLNSFVVRKKQKTYGLKNWIEGLPEKNKPVMLIDDICSSSMTMKRAKFFCEQIKIDSQELEVMKVVFAIVNKWSKYSDKDSLEHHTRQIPDTKVIHLFNCDDFELFTKRHYTSEQYERYFKEFRENSERQSEG